MWNVSECECGIARGGGGGGNGDRGEMWRRSLYGVVPLDAVYFSADHLRLTRLILAYIGLKSRSTTLIPHIVSCSDF